MKKDRCSFIVTAGIYLAAWAIIGCADTSQEKPADAPAEPPELKILQHFVGTWTTELIQKRAEWTPKEVRVTGTDTTEWVLGGRFIQSKTRSADGKSENMRLATYDAQKKEYRRWSFDSGGAFNEASGQWDEGSKSLKWEGRAGEEIPVVIKVRVVDRNTIEWTLIAKNGDGKVFLDFEGKAVRDK